MLLSAQNSAASLAVMADEDADVPQEKLDPWVNERARELVRQLRSRGWEQAQIAREAGVTAFRIGRLVDGGGTTLPVVRELARICNVSYQAILDGGAGGGIVPKSPSVSTHPDFERVKQDASRGFGQDAIAAAIRMFDAMPAARVDADSLRKAAHIAADMMADVVPTIPGPPEKGPRKKRSKSDTTTVREEIARASMAITTALKRKQARG